jgi:hypothetical protein
MTIEENMIANIIAGTSLLVSISLGVFYYMDRRHTKFQVENEYINGLLNWHNEVTATLITLKQSFQ